MRPEDPVRHICVEVGEAVIARLTAAFYRRVETDELLRPLYPEDDLEAAAQRLSDFLIGRFGGADTYVRTRGHPRLRMRHAPFPIDKSARDRWVHLMSEAIVEVDFPSPARERAAGFFAEVATFLLNR